MGDVGALPADRPAARLDRHAVGRGAGDEHARPGLDRQHAAIVLEQDERLGGRFARNRQMLRRTDGFHNAAVDMAFGEQAELVFDAQDTPHRIVEPRGRYRPVFRVLQRRFVQPLPAVGRHEHVEPGVDRLRAIGDAASRNLPMPVPVADDEARKAHLVIERVGEQPLIAVMLDTLPAREARHHGQRAGVDRGGVAHRVFRDQFLFVDLGIALVLALERPAVGEEMLGGCRDMARVDRLSRDQRPLQPEHPRLGIVGDQLRVGRIAFIAPSPTQILRHRERRSEGPLDPAPRDFGRGNRADALDQLGIARGAEPDIVREQSRAGDIVVTVDRIDAEDDRDRNAIRLRTQGHGTKIADQLRPVSRGRTFIAVRPAVPAGEDRAERVGFEVLGRDRADVGLDELADLLLDRHFRDQRIDARFGFGVGDRGGAFRCGP